MGRVAHERVSLLTVEPELARRIPPAELPLANRYVTARLLSLPEGPVELGPGRGRPGAFAAIVLDGLMLREVNVMGRVAVGLLGPGDVVRLDRAPGVLLPRTVSLTCAEATRLGVLDDQVLIAMRRWPDIAAVFVQRIGEQVERLAVQHTIGQMQRVHDRILATMWQLAERHGRVTPAGLHLPIALTHRLIGALVGARRPTVSLALTELEAEGAIQRMPNRTWLILRMPDDVPMPEHLPGEYLTGRPPAARVTAAEPEPKA